MTKDLTLDQIASEEETTWQLEKFSLTFWIFPTFTPLKVLFLAIRNRTTSRSLPISPMTIVKWASLSWRLLLKWWLRKLPLGRKIKGCFSVLRRNSRRMIMYGIAWMRLIRWNLLEVIRTLLETSSPRSSLIVSSHESRRKTRRTRRRKKSKRQGSGRKWKRLRKRWTVRQRIMTRNLLTKDFSVGEVHFTPNRSLLLLTFIKKANLKGETSAARWISNRKLSCIDLL